MTFKLLDCVALKDDLPEYELREGEVGTIVEVWKSGDFEVEFSTENGHLIALLTLKSSQLRQPTAEELTQTPRPDSDAHEYGVMRGPRVLG